VSAALKRAEAGEAGASEEVSDLIQKLGSEALRENGDWVTLHRGKPLEPRI
jgi:hypothetical protein